MDDYVNSSNCKRAYEIHVFSKKKKKCVQSIFFSFYC